MRTTQRDKRVIWYALYQGVTELTDGDGNLTGEQKVTYSTPVKTRMNVSGARGRAEIQYFGMDDSFSRTAVTADLTTPFDTETVFWFGICPYDKQGNAVPHNYRCVGIADTINGRVLALAEETISAKDNSPIISG